MNTREATRKYRIAQWAQIFQERRIEGTTILEFCKSRGISRDMYYRWQRIVRAAACEQLAAKQPEAIAGGTTSFAKVHIAERPALPGIVNPNQGASETEVHIDYGDVHLSVGGAYPPDRLAHFVKELAQI